MNIIELAKQAGLVRVGDFGMKRWEGPQSDSISDQDLEAFAALVAAQEREAIAQMFEGAPALVQSAQNDKGGCFVCGFTPKLVIEAIRARGTT